MLVLSRKPEEQVLVGENIRVTVLKVRGNRVRLGFEAPPGVPITREELRPPGQRPGGDADPPGD